MFLAEKLQTSKIYVATHLQDRFFSTQSQNFICGRKIALHVEGMVYWCAMSSAHASTAAATASLYFLSALYCSALPPRWILLQICLWPRRQWSCWQVESQ